MAILIATPAAFELRRTRGLGLPSPEPISFAPSSALPKRTSCSDSSTRKLRDVVPTSRCDAGKQFSLLSYAAREYGTSATLTFVDWLKCMHAVPCLPRNSVTWRAAIIWRRRSAQPQASNLRLRTQERKRLSAKRSPFATSQFRVSAAPDRTSSNTREPFPVSTFGRAMEGSLSEECERRGQEGDGGRFLAPKGGGDGFGRKEGGKKLEEGVLTEIDGGSATRLGGFDDGSIVADCFIPQFRPFLVLRLPHTPSTAQPVSMPNPLVMRSGSAPTVRLRTNRSSLWLPSPHALTLVGEKPGIGDTDGSNLASAQGLA
ncbi:hypothetical protein FA13DRAFT_1709668 [Coprinellus micaceus]|uniref:Uncharacterized protein n=1 Tax=Coprinellus micaceus TaxID=71717 RepID=A0A4Y7TAK4_COPMI|nr:hypothetical protein FA13DRAFT_1709668 [Coprinellus micaceus]